GPQNDAPRDAPAPKTTTALSARGTPIPRSSTITIIIRASDAPVRREASKTAAIDAKRLQRNVSVLAPRPRLALRQRRLERVDQHGARPARLDHLVDVAALGGAVRVGE